TCFLRINYIFYTLVIINIFIIFQIVIFMRTFFINIIICFTFTLSLIMKLNSFQVVRFHFLHSNDCITHVSITPFYMSKLLGIFGFSGHYFHVNDNALYFIFIKCVLCEACSALPSVRQVEQKHYDLSFFSEKKETKKPYLCHLSKMEFALVPAFENLQGTGSIFWKNHSKNLHL